MLNNHHGGGGGLSGRAGSVTTVAAGAGAGVASGRGGVGSSGHREEVGGGTSNRGTKRKAQSVRRESEDPNGGTGEQEGGERVGGSGWSGWLYILLSADTASFPSEARLCVGW